MADVKADVGRIVLRNINGKQGMSLQNSGRNNQAQQTSLMVWNSPIPKRGYPVNPSNEFLPPFEVLQDVLKTKLRHAAAAQLGS